MKINGQDGPDGYDLRDVRDEEWAKAARSLSAGERASLLQAVSVLLKQPDAISDPLETELYILRDQLGGAVPA